MKNVKYLGTVDDINTCDCCGRSGLKKTVALDFDGAVQHYGTTCAGRALGFKTKTVSDVKAAVAELSKRAKIEADVLALQLRGVNAVYGRFYVNSRTNKTHLAIQEPGPLMVRQIYPPWE